MSTPRTPARVVHGKADLPVGIEQKIHASVCHLRATQDLQRADRFDPSARAYRIFQSIQRRAERGSVQSRQSDGPPTGDHPQQFQHPLGAPGWSIFGVNIPARESVSRRSIEASNRRRVFSASYALEIPRRIEHTGHLQVCEAVLDVFGV